MKKILVLMIAAMVTTGVTSCGRAKHENASRIVLPNPKLLGCRSSACLQLWQGNPPQANAIYPRQVTIDIFGNDRCPRGILALYEKSVSTDEIKAALDQRYGKWALADFATSPVKLWRVEPEKFAIQLAVTDDRTKEAKRNEAFAFALSQVFEGSERSNVAEGGMKQVIYLAFSGEKCGSQ
jgi:hypothetical protein